MSDALFNVDNAKPAISNRDVTTLTIDELYAELRAARDITQLPRFNEPLSAEDAAICERERALTTEILARNGRR